MIFFGQRDTRWANVKIGKTNRTIAQVGCTTCTVSDATSWFFPAKPINPGTLAQRLDYTVDALILWQSLSKIGLQLKQRFYNHDKAAISAGLKDPNCTVHLNVDKGGHWVFALNAIPMTNSYWVHDPWTNSKKVYGGVVGGAIITKS
jgi:hypothetical protein